MAVVVVVVVVTTVCIPRSRRRSSTKQILLIKVFQDGTIIIACPNTLPARLICTVYFVCNSYKSQSGPSDMFLVLGNFLFISLLVVKYHYLLFHLSNVLFL